MIKNTMIKNIMCSTLLTLLFFIISNPKSFRLTNLITSPIKNNIMANGECPTATGYFLHMIVFFIASFVLMISFNMVKSVKQSIITLLKYSIYSTLLYSFVSNTYTYKLTNISGILSNNGCPNILGTSVHSIVYFIILFALMNFPKECHIST